MHTHTHTHTHTNIHTSAQFHLEEDVIFGCDCVLALGFGQVGQAVCETALSGIVGEKKSCWIKRKKRGRKCVGLAWNRPRCGRAALSAPCLMVEIRARTLTEQKGRSSAYQPTAARRTLGK